MKKSKLLVVGLSAIMLSLGFVPAHKAAKQVKADTNYVDYTKLYVRANGGAGTIQFDNLRGEQALFSIVSSDTSFHPFYDDNGNLPYLNDHQNDLSDGNGNYFVDYFYINDKSFRTLVTENAARGDAAYKSAEFPLSMGGVYAPVALQMGGGSISVKIVGSFLQDTCESAHKVTFTLKAGCPLRTQDNALYIVRNDIHAILSSDNADSDEPFAEADNSVADLCVTEAKLVTPEFSMNTVQLNFNRPLSDYNGMYILDHKIALTAFISIKGHSVQYWNDSLDDSDWSYAGHELAGGTNPGVLYNRPIRTRVDDNGNNLKLFFHPNAWASIFGDSNLYEIAFGVSQGFVYKSGSTAYYQKSNQIDKFIFAKNNLDEKYFGKTEITEITVQNGHAFANDGDAKYYQFNIPMDTTFTGLDFDANDGNSSHLLNLGIRDNILINGSSVNTINNTVDSSNYDFGTRFPQSIAQYAKPILVKMQSNMIILDVHADYVATLTASSETANVTLKAGLTIFEMTDATINSVRQVKTDKELTFDIRLAKDYTVTFNVNGGVGNYDPVVVRYNNPVAVPSSNPTKEGNHFVGWFTQATGGVAFDFNVPITEDTVIYAQYEAHVPGEVNYSSFGVNHNCTATLECQVCHEVYVTETVSGEFHNVSAATCLESAKGYYEYVFTNENFETQIQNVEIGNPKGHTDGEISYSSFTVDHKCTATIKCADCLEVIATETSTGVYHKTSDATCTEAEKGYYEYTFENTKFATQTEQVTVGNPKGHNPGVAEYSAFTADHKCTGTIKCVDCEAELVTETVEGVYHATSAATCTEAEKGYYEYLFSEVGLERQVEQVTVGEPKGHSYSDLIPEVPATTESTGMKAHYECADCGELFDENKNPATLESLTIAKLEPVVDPVVDPQPQPKPEEKSEEEGSFFDKVLSFFTETVPEFFTQTAPNAIKDTFGCEGSVVGASILVSTLSLLGVGLIIARKRED